ncbi:MAG: hypothetical protein PHC65_05245 [Methanobacteriaceae archaeon]|jgi:hypothetical protein|uniref:hypothetical protein n=1 Tax=Methanobrevibacter sp. UBA337 TaxID=1915480 RepID=UPI00375BFBCC|nr:hypothetical protein [Methanobacteriaceae archaeon]
MKFNLKNYISLILLVGVIAVAGSCVVFAADATLDDGSTFTLPTGFTVNSSSESNMVSISNEADGIFISVGSDAVKVTKDTWADKGFTFKTEKNITLNGATTTEEQYDNSGVPFYVYYVTKEDTKYTIIVAMEDNADWNVQDTANPVNSIVKTLKA